MQSGSSRGIGLGREEETQLRSLILSMIDEPLVLVVKLADRLHNMRTVFALRQDRQKSVAAETLQLWCGLAERLGMMALKVGLRDFGLLWMSDTPYKGCMGLLCIGHGDAQPQCADHCGIGCDSPLCAASLHLPQVQMADA